MPFAHELNELAARQPLLTLNSLATGDDLPDLGGMLPVPDALRGTHCYVCGPSAMVDAAARLLQTRGVDASHIHFERFDFR